MNARGNGEPIMQKNFFSFCTLFAGLRAIGVARQRPALRAARGDLWVAGNDGLGRRQQTVTL